MSRLYEKQLNQGGIINLSELDDVIDDTWVHVYICICVYENYKWGSTMVSPFGGNTVLH